MLKQHKTVQVGDLVIAYESFGSMKPVWVQEKGIFNTKFGSFNHEDWIGKPFGFKVWSTGQQGYIHLLAPTPELWTQVLKTRTQILYMADISMVCCYLELKPGSVVLESGTGSGSLSVALARAVAPKGKVHTFEFHEQRVTQAEQDFERIGISDVVTVNHRNIEEQGFPEELYSQADGVFLDLPKPQLVVESAFKCLVSDGRFCSFSPQIEQVQHTCEALHNRNFRDIRTFECLLRPYEVSRQRVITDIQKMQFIEPSRKKQKSRRRNESPTDADDQDEATEHRICAKPVMYTRGHTGFLTFARKVIQCTK
eukprot:TRINITY_DN19054_c0_g1_i1.p1 TRINITY_DN19054_c0_g1~~TRINITY_DN19054_c0_g1_i1.p1  ORF type:complete len:311 (-),score=26.63 TRINITY_DN19054_c0_g1_i1:642-1574(-)